MDLACVYVFIGNDTVHTTSKYIGSISSLAHQSLLNIILSFASSCYSSVTVMVHQYLSIVSTEMLIKYQTLEHLEITLELGWVFPPI